MFLVMFDTSTRQAYYRDVHNLLALPNGATIRYDYDQRHISQSAIDEIAKGDRGARNVLIAYAQHNNFQKNAPDPVGFVSRDEGIWIATRIANLRHTRFSAGRYYFDLEVLTYPANSIEFDAIMQTLRERNEVPFTSWVSVVDGQDDSYHSLIAGTDPVNWASIVDRLGSPPSQFTGDSFWRLVTIARGIMKRGVNPEVRDQQAMLDGQPVITGMETVYQVHDGDNLSLQIETRTPAGGAQQAEPANERHLSIATAADGPLKQLNGGSLVLRRFANEWITAEVDHSDRLDVRRTELAITTGPDAGGYPVGPELAIRFDVTKKPGISYIALILAIFGAAGIAIGSLSDVATVWAILFIVGGILAVLVAGVMFFGRVLFPGQ